MRCAASSISLQHRNEERSRGRQRRVVGRDAGAGNHHREPGHEGLPTASRRAFEHGDTGRARDIRPSRVVGTGRVLLDDGDLDAFAPQHLDGLLPRLRQPEHQHPAKGGATVLMRLRPPALDPDDDRGRCGRPRLRSRLRRAHSRTRQPEEVGVEEAEAHRRAQPREQPEPHRHRELGPATDLEVMVDRRHAQHPPAEAAERDHLRDHRQRLDHVETAEDRQEQLRAREERETRHRGTDRHGTGIAHDDLSRGRVPPEEPRAPPEHRGGDGGHVERLRAGHVVDREVAELPERDDREHREHEHRRSCCEPVETVGEVHAVARPDDHEHGPDEPERRPEVVPQVAREREVGRYVHPVQREQREPARHDDLPRELSPLAQSQVALLPDAEVVVDESDDGHGDDHREQDHARSRVLDALGPVQVGGEVADDRAADDRDATHARCAHLRDVRVRDRPVVADLLPDPPPRSQRMRMGVVTTVVTNDAATARNSAITRGSRSSRGRAGRSRRLRGPRPGWP